MPNLWEVMEICRTQQSTIDWLIENDIFYNTSTGNRILLCKNGNSRYKGLLWQCPKRSCCNRSKKTLRSDSFFYNYKIPINAVVLVIYLLRQIEEMTNLDHKTIANIISGIYDLMECELTEEDVQIGKKKYIYQNFINLLIFFYLGGYDDNGASVEVQLDESKFGKSHVEGVWVLGGVEKTSQRKVFFSCCTSKKC